MELISLKNKVALVTGAAGTIGKAITKALLQDGLNVVMVDLNEDQLRTLADNLDGEVYPLVVDIGNYEKVMTAYQDVVENFGPIDILINNAGLLTGHQSQEISAEEWRKVFAANLDGAFYFGKAVMPHMVSRQWGRIINMCSMAAKTGGVTAGTAYSASKGGLASLTFALAKEVAAHGVTVNGIAPAYVKTPMITDILTEEQRQLLFKRIPVGRFCEPEEVAHAVRFLISPLAGFITGEIIDINGGLHFD